MSDEITEVFPVQGGTIRYRLRAITAPRPTESLSRVQLKTNNAIRVPADIYSLGCIVAWFVMDGNMRLLHQLRTSADFVTARGLGVHSDLPRNALGELSHTSILNAMALPHGSQDEEVRRMVLDVIFRCLVRGEGAYAHGRASGFTLAASRAANDLRRIRDRLFFSYRTETEYAAFLQEGAANVVEELHRRIAELEAELPQTAKFQARIAELEAANTQIEVLEQRAIDADASSRRRIAAAEAGKTEAERSLEEQERRATRVRLFGRIAVAGFSISSALLLFHWLGVVPIPAMGSTSMLTREVDVPPPTPTVVRAADPPPPKVEPPHDVPMPSATESALPAQATPPVAAPTSKRPPRRPPPSDYSAREK